MILLLFILSIALCGNATIQFPGSCPIEATTSLAEAQPQSVLFSPLEWPLFPKANSTVWYALDTDLPELKKKPVYKSNPKQDARIFKGDDKPAFRDTLGFVQWSPTVPSSTCSTTLDGSNDWLPTPPILSTSMASVTGPDSGDGCVGAAVGPRKKGEVPPPAECAPLPSPKLLQTGLRSLLGFKGEEHYPHCGVLLWSVMPYCRITCASLADPSIKPCKFDSISFLVALDSIVHTFKMPEAEVIAEFGSPKRQTLDAVVGAPLLEALKKYQGDYLRTADTTDEARLFFTAMGYYSIYRNPGSRMLRVLDMWKDQNEILISTMGEIINTSDDKDEKAWAPDIEKVMKLAVYYGKPFDSKKLQMRFSPSEEQPSQLFTQPTADQLFFEEAADAPQKLVEEGLLGLGHKGTERSCYRLIRSVLTQIGTVVTAFVSILFMLKIRMRKTWVVYTVVLLVLVSIAAASGGRDPWNKDTHKKPTASTTAKKKDDLPRKKVRITRPSSRRAVFAAPPDNTCNIADGPQDNNDHGNNGAAGGGGVDADEYEFNLLPLFVEDANHEVPAQLGAYDSSSTEIMGMSEVDSQVGSADGSNSDASMGGGGNLMDFSMGGGGSMMEVDEPYAVSSRSENSLGSYADTSDGEDAPITNAASSHSDAGTASNGGGNQARQAPSEKSLHTAQSPAEETSSTLLSTSSISDISITGSTHSDDGADEGDPAAPVLSDVSVGDLYNNPDAGDNRVAHAQPAQSEYCLNMDEYSPRRGIILFPEHITDLCAEGAITAQERRDRANLAARSFALRMGIPYAEPPPQCLLEDAPADVIVPMRVEPPPVEEVNQAELTLRREIAARAAIARIAHDRKRGTRTAAIPPTVEGNRLLGGLPPLQMDPLDVWQGRHPGYYPIEDRLHVRAGDDQEIDPHRFMTAINSLRDEHASTTMRDASSSSWRNLPPVGHTSTSRRDATNSSWRIPGLHVESARNEAGDTRVTSTSTRTSALRRQHQPPQYARYHEFRNQGRALADQSTLGADHDRSPRQTVNRLGFRPENSIDSPSTTTSSTLRSQASIPRAETDPPRSEANARVARSEQTGPTSFANALFINCNFSKMNVQGQPESDH